MNPFESSKDRKERKTSRNFVSPTRDEATTGRFMVAGDDHGIGFKCPVGSKNVSMKGGIPMTSSCKDPNEI